jgi:hypothetical protein
MVAFRGPGPLRSVPVVERLTQMGPGDPTTRLRLVNARIALAAFTERPVVGWGLNSFRQLYARHFDPANLTNDPRFADKVHNVYAEILAEQGLLGFLAYLVCVGYLFVVLWPARTAAEWLLMAGLAGYLFQNAFLFDMPTARLVAAVLLGVIASRDPRGWRMAWPGGRGARVAMAGAAGALLLYAASLGWLLALSRTASDVAYDLPRSAASPAVVEQELDRFLARRSFFNREALIEMSRAAEVQPGGARPSPELLRILHRALLQDFDARPNDYQLGLRILKAASDLSAYDPSYAGAFAHDLPRVTALAPLRPETYMLAGSLAFREGRIEEGQRKYLAAARLNPGLAFPYWALGRELFLAGRPLAARPYVETALAKGFAYGSPGGLTTLIRLYHALGDTARAAAYVREAARSQPSVLDSALTQ